MTWVSSPSGRKGRHLGRENRDKGWAERGRWRTGSWDAGLTVEDSERTRLQTHIDSSWRDASLRARQLRRGGLFSEKRPETHSARMSHLENGRHEMSGHEKGERWSDILVDQTGRRRGMWFRGWSLGQRATRKATKERPASEKKSVQEIFGDFSDDLLTRSFPAFLINRSAVKSQ